MKRHRNHVTLTAILALLVLSSHVFLFLDFAGRLRQQSAEQASLLLLQSVLLTLLFAAVLVLVCSIPFFSERERNRNLAEDIQCRMAHEADLLARSSLDDLTGLLNRSAMALRVEEFIRSPCSKQGGALLMLDLDDFKSINDTCGHASGDRALLLTAQSLRDTFRCSDVLGRAGGDEFLVFLPGANGEQAGAKALQLCNTVADRSRLELGSPFTCSVGAAVFPKDGTDFQQLFLSADAAMYRAKRSGKGGCQLSMQV